MKMRYLFWTIFLAYFGTACFDDKGNYDYIPVDELTIELPQEYIPALANADTIRVTPKIHSKLEGEILPDNPNYEYKYLAAKKGSANSLGALFVLDSTFSRNLEIPARLAQGTYVCWLQVQDKRTEITYSKEFSINISLETSEGWMVLCEEGDKRRVRLDMVVEISEGRVIQTYDILGNYLPSLHEAYSLHLFQDTYGIDDFIYLLSGSGGYKLDPTYLTSGAEYCMDYEFATQEKKRIPSTLKLTAYYRVIVDQNHDVYAMDNSAVGGIYEFPLNLDGNGNRFNVAPYVATDINKTSYYLCPSALLYDTDNRRFMQWVEENTECHQIQSSPDDKFDYTTGKELVYMESTVKGQTVVYAILKEDSGKYYLAGISMVTNMATGGATYKQEYYDEIKVDDIDQATAFAFHSKFPYLYYAIGNQVFLYNYHDRCSYPMFDLPSEEITLLKFNLPSKSYMFNPPAIVEEMPDQLIIGSIESGKETSSDKGILRFYKIQELNGIPTLIGEPYRGFAKIKDVLYREK